MSGFWTRAKILMNRKGLSKSDLAKAVEKPFATVFHWLERDTVPDAVDALKVADVLGTSVRWLCTGKECASNFGGAEEAMAILKEVPREDWENVAELIKVYNKGRGSGRFC